MNNTLSEMKVNKKLSSNIGVLAALSVSLFASSIATSIANVALPTLSKVFFGFLSGSSVGGAWI